MPLSLVDLPPIASLELPESVEHRIPIHRCCATKLRRDRGTLALLERCLRELRQGGYEAEIYLEGTFRLGSSGRPQVLDLLLEGWQLTAQGVLFDPPLGHEWSPLPAYQPRPTFVVLGHRPSLPHPRQPITASPSPAS